MIQANDHFAVSICHCLMGSKVVWIHQLDSLNSSLCYQKQQVLYRSTQCKRVSVSGWIAIQLKHRLRGMLDLLEIMDTRALEWLHYIGIAFVDYSTISNIP